MGINIVFFVGGLTLFATFEFESRASPSTTENPSPFIPTTSTTGPTTTSMAPSTSTTGTSTQSSTETTSKSNELHFEMSEWRNGHCEGNGQCPCHWVETRYCQAINSGTSSNTRTLGRPQYPVVGHESHDYNWFFSDGVIVKTYDPEVNPSGFEFKCKVNMESNKSKWDRRCGWGCGRGWSDRIWNHCW